MTILHPVWYYYVNSTISEHDVGQTWGWILYIQCGTTNIIIPLDIQVILLGILLLARELYVQQKEFQHFEN